MENQNEDYLQPLIIQEKKGLSFIKIKREWELIIKSNRLIRFSTKGKIVNLLG